MFRSRGENLRSVFVLLFLNISFFLLETQDAVKYKRLFAFHWDAVQAGEFWRLVTYQFHQPGTGFAKALWLFFSMMLLYIMGSALEEEWGTRHLLTLFTVSTLASAAAATFLGVPLFGTYFLSFTLLYVYASAFPHQTFYFWMIPFPVRFLAGLSLAYLLIGVFVGARSNLAALAGAVAGYLYFISQRIPVRTIVARAEAELGRPENRVDGAAIQNAARFAGMKQALAADRIADVERLIAQSEREIIHGVNICPPADFKPENTDGYCIRCEGFAECSARYLKANRPVMTAVPDGPLPDPTI